ncbi:hypothetical protein EYF80_025376 [Liparis tanakae]|uniref:Uncharacterized protein n=1 Tax=Liparis tanakae TaxID=230148 RepID=A0A4Z2HFD9_9TELE|nr:hypothetical protein EYF80_025376 [Liparis tanakae]
MHFQNSESRHVVSQHNPVGTCGLVHTLYDLEVAVSEEEVVLIDSHPPGVRQACHDGDAVTPIYVPALNLWRQQHRFDFPLEAVQTAMRRPLELSSFGDEWPCQNCVKWGLPTCWVHCDANGTASTSWRAVICD